ncbi:MAG: hypothetical protein V4671_20090 [Armatimonadota bacterium]
MNGLRTWLRPLALLVVTAGAVAVWGRTDANVARDTAAPARSKDGFIVVQTLDDLRQYATTSGVKVRLQPGAYQIRKAPGRKFIEFSGSDSHFDLRGVTLQVDNDLFRQFGSAAGPDGIYAALNLSGSRITLDGVTIENLGTEPGIQSRNKLVNITGSNVVLRDVTVRTSGSSPWGYGSLFGISGGPVRKMNGIRVGYPAQNVQILGCRVHMRAMGHAIFVQGARGTLIRDSHVDGLLRPTNDILTETSGYAFDRNFEMIGNGEGVYRPADGRIPPNDMMSLSEDGIRMYPDDGQGHPTGPTRIENCTVLRMRRGICTGLSAAGDTVVNSEARECIATGFNLGTDDLLKNCRADAKYGEALCLPYSGSRNARADLTILDSRGGMGNDLLVKITGSDHDVVLRSESPASVPPGMVIELASRRGYGFWQRDVRAENIRLVNETSAPVLLKPNTTRPRVTSRSPVRDETKLLSTDALSVGQRRGS